MMSDVSNLNVEEIFASSMIDLVFIGTPNSTHAKKF